MTCIFCKGPAELRAYVEHSDGKQQINVPSWHCPRCVKYWLTNEQLDHALRVWRAELAFELLGKLGEAIRGWRVP